VLLLTRMPAAAQSGEASMRRSRAFGWLTDNAAGRFAALREVRLGA